MRTVTTVRLFVVDPRRGPIGRVDFYKDAQTFRDESAQRNPERIYIAWEENADPHDTVSGDPSKWFGRCMAAIERGHHWGTREEAIALATEARLKG